MQIPLTVRDPAGHDHDLEVSAGRFATLADVTARLGLGSTTAYAGDGHRLPEGALLGGPGLRRGSLLSLGTANRPSEPARSALRLHVVGGPDSGQLLALPLGTFVIGRDPDCSLRLQDPDVSRRHVEIAVTATAVLVRDLGSTNGSSIEGEPLVGPPRPLGVGEYVRLGNSVISLDDGSEPAAAIRPGPDGELRLNRPPRLDAPSPQHCLDWPTEPARDRPARLQWIAALMPAVAGGALAAYLHNVQFLAFSLLTPLMMLGTGLGDRLDWRHSRRRRYRQHQIRLGNAQRELNGLLRAEVAHRRLALPDPASILRTATLPEGRLWKRRPTDVDHLQLRLGLGSLPSSLVIRRQSRSEPASTLADVPVSVRLDRGPLGLAGPEPVAAGIARWLVTQLAVLQSPVDLELAFLLTARSGSQWQWARWLPHLRDRIATTASAHRTLVAEIQALIDGRTTRADGQGWTGRWTVVVVDRSGELADVPGLARMLASGAARGVTAICIDQHARLLPTSCLTVALVHGETGTQLRLHDGEPPSQLTADQVSTPVASAIARALAPLVDSGADAAASIPDTCRLVDLLDLADPDASSASARWGLGIGPRATVGRCADGDFEIDLVQDGPHVLIAGTTGAGKSEFLQTLIVALAVNNSPLELTFVLIDYKGGAAFADCAALPHTAGLVTDLDPHLTERALVSLNAELRRREQLLAIAGAKDLESYRHAANGGPPLARLVLVVDEFAALSDELPAFVTGLIAIAQRGRSLGVHLVLATQRPGGVVSAEIRANMSLRIALRVTDPTDSCDVIGIDSAASIDKQHPGRAFVRTGSTVIEIQAGRVGGPAVPARTQLEITELDDWARRPRSPDGGPTSATDLRQLTAALASAATGRGLPAPAQPWLPALPAELPLDPTLATLVSPSTPEQVGVVAIGLLDEPNRQRQSWLSVDLDAARSVLFVGGPRSGRSVALRTLALAAAAQLGPNRLHLYVIDCAGGSLRELTDLPHCGAVIDRDHPEAIAALLRRITSEIHRRQLEFSALGAGSLRDANRDGDRFARLLLLVDGWEGLLAASDEHDVGQSVEHLFTVLREASRVGVTVAITGGRAALTSRLASGVGERFVLRLADHADYGLAGVAARQVPGRMPPGRAIRTTDCLVAQIARAGPVAEVAALHRVDDPDQGPFRVRELPTRVRLADLAPTAPGNRSEDRLLIGVGGAERTPVSLDLFAGDARWLVGGPPRSGRTTLLRTIQREAARIGVAVAVAAPRRSSDLDGRADARRPVAILRPDADPPACASFGRTVSAMTRCLLLIDDCEAFADSAADGLLWELSRRTRPGSLAVVLAGRSEDLALAYRGLAAEIRGARSGLLLQPRPTDGDLLGIHLPRGRCSAVPGRGVLVSDQLSRQLVGTGEPLPIQVAEPV